MALPRPLQEYAIRRLLLLFSVLPLISVLVIACQTNPIAIAETPAQRAYALVGLYNVLLEPAVEIIEDESAPLEVRRSLQDGVRATAPVVDELEDALRAYLTERAAWEAGGPRTPTDTLDALSENLERWMFEAEARIDTLQELLRR